MQSWLSAALDPSGLTPHGFCLLWDPALIWLQAGSDALIGLAYFSIPLALVSFVRQRKDIAFRGILWLFAAFIMACGTSHFMAIVTLWVPAYWLEGTVKLATAIVSVITAALLWPLIPRALALPSPSSLRLVNEELSRQIAERDQTAERLRANQAQLRQAQKMDAIGRLTGGIAHDFNNILTVMLGTLELLHRRMADRDARMIRLLDGAIDAGKRAAVLIDRLLAFARQQPLAPHPLDVNDLVSGLSDLVRRTLNETFDVRMDLTADLWLTNVDANQLENALINLAVNSRDAMPGGGRLTIQTGNVHLDPPANAAEDRPETAGGDYVLLAVLDTGTGMPPEVAARAFDPFFTTKAPGQGTGLGLSQVFGFVTQSGGAIAIESEPGQGTAVRLYLPRYEGPLLPGKDASSLLASPQASRGETILVVEDDIAVRAFSADALRELGYAVLTAEDATSALEILDGDWHVDLMFTDVVLPGSSGRELAERARIIRPALRILFTSGYSSNTITHDGVLDDDVRFLVKPFSVEQIAKAIRNALDATAD